MSRESVHAYLARLVPNRVERVLDLGCGSGATLSEIARRRSGVALVGVDRNEKALAEAVSAMSGIEPQPELLAADASSGLPFASGAFDCVVCHNVLECMPNPVDTINEIDRVLRPGSEAILGHTDFGSLVFNSGLPELTRQAVELYASHTWGHYADGLLGRKLPGLVRSSSLEIIEVSVHTTISLRFAAGEKGYERATKELAPLLAPEDARRWLEDFEGLDQGGAFLSSENAYVVRANRRPAS